MERLKRVVEVLRGVPDAEFRIETWWKPNCKTVGCAVGHYVHETPGCGLALVQDEFDKSIFRVVTEGKKPYDDWHDVWEHFGLSNIQSYYLFDGNTYDNVPTRDDVIDRIEAFIASEGVIEDPELAKC